MMHTFASKWEQTYARLLDARVAAGEIHDWYYEPFRIPLAPKTTYLPDFMIVHLDGSIEFVEVKGRRYDDAIAKYKIAAHMHPWAAWTMVSKEKDGSWKKLPGFTFPIQGRRAPRQVLEVPLKALVPLRKPLPKTMTYKQMEQDPELARILKLTPSQILKLRLAHGLSCNEMAERLNMTPTAYSRIESGQTKLYHYRHVLIIKNLMEAS